MERSTLENNFTYHPPTGLQTEQYSFLRDVAKSLARQINDTCPESREKALALTKLEESVFWANASIARNE